MTEPPDEAAVPGSDQAFSWLDPTPPATVGSPAVDSAPVTGSSVALPESVPYEVQAYPMPTYGQAYPTHTYGRSYPAEVYPPQPADDAPWPLIIGEPPRRRRRRPSLLLGLIIALVVVLAGGATAAFILVGPSSSRGSATPAEAVEGFLDAIYGKHSAKDAARFVCERARNDAELDQIVFAVKTFEQEFTSPRTTWAYPAIQPNGRQATTTVTLTMTTANEQVSERRLTLLLVDDRGWWVCDVETIQ
jgi:hypothetical protein